MSSLVSDRFRLDLADTHLGAGQVGHDGNSLARGARGGADPRDAFGVPREVAVRKVEPCDIEPCSDKSL
jgi:hypothetical protein